MVEGVTGNHATLVDELVKKLDIGVANLLHATPTSARSSCVFHSAGPPTHFTF
jgi:hypothetical protein